MLSSVKAKVIAFFGLLASLVLVYLIGRRNRKGEVNLSIAQRELDMAQKQHEKLQTQITDLHEKQTSIIADILEEQSVRITKAAGNEKLTDDQVIERLRTDGLIQ